MLVSFCVNLLWSLALFIFSTVHLVNEILNYFVWYFILLIFNKRGFFWVIHLMLIIYFSCQIKLLILPMSQSLAMFDFVNSIFFYLFNFIYNFLAFFYFVTFAFCQFSVILVILVVTYFFYNSFILFNFVDFAFNVLYLFCLLFTFLYNSVDVNIIDFC